MKALVAFCITAVTFGGIHYDSIPQYESREVFQFSPSVNSVNVSVIQSETERAADLTR